MSPNQVPKALLDKYQTSAPRYTSYPTAVQFTAAFDTAAARERWRAGNTGSPRDLSLYIHVPFCRQRCLYCGCHTRVGCSQETVDRYLSGVLEHLDRTLEVLDPTRPVEQVSFGGGTPTYLGMQQMADLVGALKSRLTFTAGGERAIEVDPRHVTEDYLDLLLSLGFNRFSFGIQDLDVSVQKAVKRELPFERIAAHMAHLHGKGMRAVNLDLIYGLPGQTVESFSATVDRIVTLRPTRIALFGYAHVPWVSPHQKELEGLPMPDAAQRMEIFGAAFERLLDAGFRHVGMDHFALPEDELISALESRTLSRNFMGYTTRRGLDLLALGASGISSVSRTYTQNEKEITPYVDMPGLKWVKGLLLSDEDLLRREVILDLFCNFHLDVRAVERKFGIEFSSHFGPELTAMAPMADDGLVRIEPGALDVTDVGRFFVRNVAMVFDQYVKAEGPSGTGRYSKVI